MKWRLCDETITMKEGKIVDKKCSSLIEKYGRNNVNTFLKIV